ncbi:ATP-binding protein [Calothrix sp. 336/3]|uniref:ATP-binding protein n=1 Tax=Calothrix sp. 336/3 TaxID=1337936 RepID=UPI00069B419A|nr:ATP-binding protein [Calothrix sp. 336/3]
MEANEALRFINDLLLRQGQKALGKSEEKVFIGCWEGKTYTQIAAEAGYAEISIREIATKKLFPKIKNILQVEVGKNTFVSTIRHKYQEYTENQTRENHPPRQPPVNNAATVNPFFPLSGKVDDLELFFPRESLLHRVFEYLNNGSSVALIGEQGLGKSSLLWVICQLSPERLNMPRQAVFLDLNEIEDDEDDFYRALCDGIGVEECRGNQFNRLVREKRILLAIDNLGKLARNGFTRNIRDKLRSLAEGMDKPLRLVVAANQPLQNLFQDSHDTSPLADFCLTEHLSLWDDGTMRAFITTRLQNAKIKHFDEQDILRLIAESGGHPQRLMRLCYDTYRDYLYR